MADDDKTWSSMERRATWVLLTLLWLGSIVMLANAVSLGWLGLMLAVWMTGGLIYSGWFVPGTLR